MPDNFNRKADKSFTYQLDSASADPLTTRDMAISAKEITYGALLRYVKTDSLRELARSLGYQRDKRRGLTMLDDYNVKYYRSEFYDKPCVYVMHEGAYYIFFKPETANETYSRKGFVVF